MKKIISIALSLVMCLGMFLGLSTPVSAAGEQMSVYMLQLPRGVDPNKSGWGNPSLNYMGGWSTSSLSTHYISCINGYNGQVAYCIEPGIFSSTGNTFTAQDEGYWDSYPSDRNPTIPPDTIKVFIGRIMQYGWSGSGNTNWNSADGGHAAQLSAYYATQLLIWETIVGERDSQFNKVNANSQGRNNIAEYILGNHPLYGQIFSYYSAIEQSVRSHSTLPSFFTRSSGSANTYELKWDGSKYTVSLTDTNGVLGNYRFSSTTAGLNFSVSGNTLTITSATAVRGAITIIAEKTGGYRKGVVVWSDGMGGRQNTATYGAEVADPVIGYLNLEIKTGNIKLIKHSEDGKVDNISFTFVGEGYSGTKTTDANGVIDITDLNPGVYTVTEQTVDKYTPQAVQRVTVVSGQTATVTFSNVLKAASFSVNKDVSK